MLRDDEMQGDHGAGNWADDWVAQGPQDGEPGLDAELQYVVTTQALGASPSTVASAAEVGLFVADMSSPKFDAALVESLITTAEPPSSSTPAPTVKTVVVHTESPPSVGAEERSTQKKEKKWRLPPPREATAKEVAVDITAGSERESSVAEFAARVDGFACA